jgi:putative addiction module killer protein
LEARPRELLFLEAGRVPQWLDALEGNDESAYYAVLIRLERAEEGNFGDCRAVGGGVSELRFLNTGPGYRIYFGEHNDIVVILRAGTKKTQGDDIKIAQRLWSEYNK